MRPSASKPWASGDSERCGSKPLSTPRITGTHRVKIIPVISPIDGPRLTITITITAAMDTVRVTADMAEITATAGSEGTVAASAEGMAATDS